MEFRPITENSPDLPLFDALNRQAFPENERIETKDLLSMADRLGLDILGIYDGGVFVGMLVMCRYRHLAYIGYFAIRGELRGQGLGSKAIRTMREYYAGKQIVVDFEAPDAAYPNNAQRLRRREFYLRNGFCETGWFQFYMQTEFEIFCSEKAFDKALFDEMQANIHAHIPEIDPHPYRKEAQP